MDYISIGEASEKWGISPRRIQSLCTQGRIVGVIRFGKAWAIPKETNKPADRRVKNGKYTRKATQESV
ncbi:helix-turn-helix domain-containing protein [Paenibacillus larvae]